MNNEYIEQNQRKQEFLSNFANSKKLINKSVIFNHLSTMIGAMPEFTVYDALEHCINHIEKIEEYRLKELENSPYPVLTVTCDNMKEILKDYKI
jgi:hypothetical protein